MSLDNEAIRPGNFEALPQEPDDVEQEKEFEQMDSQIANLFEHPGWQRVVEKFNQKIDAYEKLQGINFDNVSLEDIGKQTVISKAVAIELRSILTEVETINANIRRSTK